MPSNSRKIFFSRLPAGRRKCLRYHAMPVGSSAMSLRKASSSFHARGVVTIFQPESSKSAFSAPPASPTKSFQSELKLYFTRSPVTERSAPNARIEENKTIKKAIVLNIIKSISQRFYIGHQRTRRNGESLERIGLFRVEFRQVFD